METKKIYLLYRGDIWLSTLSLSLIAPFSTFEKAVDYLRKKRREYRLGDTCLRLNRDIIPEGLHAYDIRESDTGGEFATIEPRVIVNRAGTILSKEVIEMDPEGFVEIEEYGFEDSMTHSVSTFELAMVECVDIP